MSTSDVIFLIVGGVGFVLLIVSVVFGELLAFGHEVSLHLGTDALDQAGAGQGESAYAPSWFSTRILSAGMTGFGTIGYTAAFYGAPTYLAWLLAVFGLFGVGWIVQQFIIKPMTRQQYNSLLGRQSYVGCCGSVTLSIPSDGLGQVSFRDTNGGLVSQRAVSANNEPLKAGTKIIIVGIRPNDVVVEPDPLKEN